jgi:hypothetical protein
MQRAVAADASRDYLSAFRDEEPQDNGVFVVNCEIGIRAKLTDLTLSSALS